MNSLFKLLALICLLLPFNLIAQSWEQVATLPGAARHHPVTFSLDGFGYLVTGSTRTPDFYRYDPSIDEWEQLTDFPGDGRSFSYGVTFNGKAYLGFGRANGQNYDDLWEYDPVTETWTELANLPGVGRAHPAMIAGSGKIWVGLGSGPDGNLNDWWEYDIATDNWQQQPDFPSFERHHPYYFEIDGKPYVGFGHGAGIYNDFYQFDFENDSWITLASLPDQGRVAGTQFSFNGKGYILSGQGDTHEDLPTGEFWEYDPGTDTWEQLVPHPGGGRWAPGSFVLGAEVYLLCGNQSDTGNKNDMWRGELPVTVANNDLISNTELKVSPNPASDFIQIQSELYLSAGATVAVLSIDGKVLMMQEYQEEMSMHVGFLKSGVYLLKIYDEKKAETIRFVVTK